MSLTYPDLVRWRCRVCLPGCLSPGRWWSSADWARAQSHIVGVLPPFPRIDHEVAEAGACRCQGLCFPRLDRRGLYDRNQNSLWRVVAKNDMRVLVFCHCMDVKPPPKHRLRAATVNANLRTQMKVINSASSQSGVNMSFISREDKKYISDPSFREKKKKYIHIYPKIQ